MCRSLPAYPVPGTMRWVSQGNFEDYIQVSAFFVNPQMQYILRHNSSGRNAYTGKLKRKEIHNAITLHPIKQAPLMYRLHSYVQVSFDGKSSLLSIETLGPKICTTFMWKWRQVRGAFLRKRVLRNSWGESVTALLLLKQSPNGFSLLHTG